MTDPISIAAAIAIAKGGVDTIKDANSLLKTVKDGVQALVNKGQVIDPELAEAIGALQEQLTTAQERYLATQEALLDLKQSSLDFNRRKALEEEFELHEEGKVTVFSKRGTEDDHRYCPACMAGETVSVLQRSQYYFKCMKCAATLQHTSQPRPPRTKGRF